MRFPEIVSNIYRRKEGMASDRDVFAFMRGKGMPRTPDSISYTPGIHRFSTDEAKPRDDAGWYIAEMFSTDKAIVSFGDFRSGAKGTFVSGREGMTEDERLELDYRIEQHRKAEEEYRRRFHDEKAAEALALWSTLSDATVDNAYIKRKMILPHDTKAMEDGRLVIPLFNANGELRSLQFIPEDGKGKRFYFGTSVKSCFWWLGNPESMRVFLCEGFATAASINEATRSCVFIAFSASAIPDTAKVLREMGKDVTVVADNDPPGIEWANRAEGCHVVVIPTEGEDANDYQVRTGALKEILPDLSVVSKMLSADDIAVEPLTMSWFIKGWIPTNSIGMIHGPSASGKTNIVMDMLLSASSGMPDWHGNRIKRPMNVVYLCGEGLFGVKLRIRAWKSHNGAGGLGNFAVYPLPLDLDTPAGIHEIREQMDVLTWRPDIIIVDTVNRYMSGDENSAQDTRTFLNCVDALRTAYSCSGLYVHHTGNDETAQKRARGSSAWKGALDFEISVNVLDDGRTRMIEQIKMKDAELLPPMYGIIEGEPLDVFDDEGEQVTGAVFDVCDEPRSESDGKLDEAVSLMFRVYTESGRTDNHIDRAYWRKWLVDNGKAKDEGNANVWLSKTSDEKRPIGRLFKEGILSREGDGFYINPGPRTVFMLGLLNRRKVD